MAGGESSGFRIGIRYLEDTRSVPSHVPTSSLLLRTQPLSQHHTASIALSIPRPTVEPAVWPPACLLALLAACAARLGTPPCCVALCTRAAHSTPQHPRHTMHVPRRTVDDLQPAVSGLLHLLSLRCPHRTLGHAALPRCALHPRGPHSTSAGRLASCTLPAAAACTDCIGRPLQS